jgi:hypothetical protein
MLGGDLIDLGAARHINEKSGHGRWPDGHKLVERLLHANGRSVSVGRAAESPVRRSLSVVGTPENDHGSLGLNSERQTQRFTAEPMPSHPADPLMQK